MSRSQFKLGQRVKFCASSEKLRIGNRSLRANYPLQRVETGVIVGSRNFQTGTVSETGVFSRTGCVHCFLIAQNLHNKHIAVEPQYIEALQ